MRPLKITLEISSLEILNRFLEEIQITDGHKSEVKITEDFVDQIKITENHKSEVKITDDLVNEIKITDDPKREVKNSSESKKNESLIRIKSLKIVGTTVVINNEIT